MQRIRCFVSGREYEVTFDDSGEATNVQNIGLYRNRTTWTCFGEKAPSLLASCVIRTAQRKLSTIGSSGS